MRASEVKTKFLDDHLKKDLCFRSDPVKMMLSAINEEPICGASPSSDNLLHQLE